MKLQLITHHFEAQPVATLKKDDGSIWFRAKDLAAPLGVGRNTIRMQVADLEPVDKGVNRIDTLGGPQKMTFVSESGALQIIVQSRKPAARRLRKWVCDLAVRYAKGEVVEATHRPLFNSQMIADLAAAIAQATAQAVTAAVSQLLMERPSATEAAPTQTQPEKATTEKWTLAEHMRMRAQGFITATELLTHKLNRKPLMCEASSLIVRTMAYCRCHNLEFKIFRKRGKNCIYVPQTAAELVHRTNWTVRTRAIAEAQGNLWS